MRYVRDIFEAEASGVFSLLQTSLTKIQGGEEKSIEILGSGIGESHRLPENLTFPL